MPMPREILRRGVVAFPFRQDHGPVRKLLDMSGEVAVPCYRTGDNDAVVIVETNQPTVEGPVAELAQGQAVGGAVIKGDGPVLDVGGVHHGTAVRGDDADAAQGAAVVVNFDDDPAERLVADGFFHGFFVGRRSFPEEFGGIIEGRNLGIGQVEKGFFQRGDEAATDQSQSSSCTVDGVLQSFENILVQRREGISLSHVLPRGRLRGGQGLAGERVQGPETVRLQVEEGQVDARAQAIGQDGVPVEHERVSQVLVGHDPVFRDPVCLHEVQHCQEQERLVRCPAESLSRPGGCVGILPDGWKGERWLKHVAL